MAGTPHTKDSTPSRSRAAQDHVRVAVALTDLPVTHGEFARGQLSYSKVRALTRFITPGNETDTVMLARHTTASQLDRIARAHVAACRAADPDQNRAALDASSVSMRTNTDGTVRPRPRRYRDPRDESHRTRRE